MGQKQSALWFSIVSIILILFGIIYVFFGLKILPVNRDVLLQWESSLYGAIMTGWGITLFFAGRIAFRRNDAELMRAIMYGLIIWLMIEGIFSAYLHVWFNVGVDIGVLILFISPLIKSIRSHNKKDI